MEEKKKAAPAELEQGQLEEVKKELSRLRWIIAISNVVFCCSICFLSFRINRIVDGIWGDVGLMDRVVTAIRLLLDTVSTAV